MVDAALNLKQIAVWNREATEEKLEIGVLQPNEASEGVAFIAFSYQGTHQTSLKLAPELISEIM